MLVRLSGVSDKLSDSVAELEVSHLQGPKPTRVGPLAEMEINILIHLARNSEVLFPALEEWVGGSSLLDKRKLWYHINRLSDARLINRDCHYTAEKYYKFSINEESLNYLIQAGKC